MCVTQTLHNQASSSSAPISGVSFSAGAMAVVSNLTARLQTVEGQVVQLQKENCDLTARVCMVESGNAAFALPCKARVKFV